MIRRFNIVISRTGMLYVLAGLVLLAAADFPGAWNHVVTQTLSRYRPPHDYLIAFNRDRTILDIKKNKEFELYYRKLSQLMPQLPEGHALLGFCYYYDGQLQLARDAYEKAAGIYSKVFNFHYNRGVIALKMADKAKALAAFKKALDVPVRLNAEYVGISPVYQPFLPEDTRKYYQEVYQRAYWELLTLAQEQKDYAAVLNYSDAAVVQDFIEPGVGNYYAGLAAYELGAYEKAAMFIQEAVKQGFSYAQAFEILGRSLAVLKRPESGTALAAAVSLAKTGKVFKQPVPVRELLIY